MKIIPAYLKLTRRYWVLYWICVAAYEYAHGSYYPYRKCPDWAVQYVAINTDLDDAEIDSSEYDLIKLAQDEWYWRSERKRKARR